MRGWLLFLVVMPAVLLLVACGQGDDDDDDSGDDDDAVDDDDDDNDDDTAPPLLKVGFSKVDITPEESVKMAGYGSFFLLEAACRWSKGVHDPLFAHAVAFEDADGDAAILIVLDNVGTITTEIVKIQEAIAAQTGLPTKSILVAATHNHHGPDTIGLWGLLIPPRSGRDEDYIAEMVERSIQAGLTAWNSRVPATLKYAVGQDSRYHFNYVTRDPNALLDSTMTVLAAYDQAGSLIGSIMNWAAHPTVMRMTNREISADYPGAYYQAMEQELDGIHMYVNGAIGASVQPYSAADDGLYDDSTWEDWWEVGSALADTAQTLIEQGTEIDDTDLWLLETRELSIRLENIVFWLMGLVDLIPRPVPDLGEEGTTYMTTFALGPISFGTMPGEYVPNYSFEMRQVMGGDAQIIIGMGMDWVGYAIKPVQYTDFKYFYERFLCPSRFTGEELMNQYDEIWGAVN